MIAAIGSSMVGGIAPIVDRIAPPAAPGFAATLESAIKSVDDKQASADQALYGLATGENVDLHTTMISLEEANIALRTMVSTRDKVVEAYQQIWNMPI